MMPTRAPHKALALSRFVRLTPVPSTAYLRAMVGCGESDIKTRRAACGKAWLARAATASAPWLVIACSASPRPIPCSATPLASASTGSATNPGIGWLRITPRDYQHVPWRLEGATCLAEADRCPFEPQRVPLCPEGVRLERDMENHNGEALVVAGQLSVGFAPRCAPVSV